MQFALNAAREVRVLPIPQRQKRLCEIHAEAERDRGRPYANQIYLLIEGYDLNQGGTYYMTDQSIRIGGNASNTAISQAAAAGGSTVTAVTGSESANSTALPELTSLFQECFNSLSQSTLDQQTQSVIADQLKALEGQLKSGQHNPGLIRMFCNGLTEFVSFVPALASLVENVKTMIEA